MSVRPSAGPSGSPSPSLVLALVCAAQLLLQLDFSIVNVALSQVQDDLGFTPASLPWVVTGYALTYGCLLLPAGRLADVIGHRRAMLTGLTVFALASLSGGLAGSPLVLVLSRLVQGAGAALVAPAALALLTAAFPASQERARALAVFQASVAAGATAGIVLGGVLVEWLGWRSVLLVNPPVIAVLAPLMRRWLPPSSGAAAGSRPNVAASLLFTAALVSLVLGVTNTEQHGLSLTWVLTPVVLAVALMLVVASTQRRAADPLLPVRLLREKARVGALLVVFLLGAVVAGYVYFIALYLQQVLVLSPFSTGLGLLPATLTVMFCSTVLSSRLIARLGVRAVLVLALPLTAAGQLYLSRISADGSYLSDVLAGLFLTAGGMGLALPAASVAVTTAVPAHMRGAAGGLLVSAQQLGGTVGLAVLSGVATAVSVPGADPVSGFRAAFLAGAGVALLGAFAALTLVRSPPAAGPTDVRNSSLDNSNH